MRLISAVPIRIYDILYEYLLWWIAVLSKGNNFFGSSVERVRVLIVVNSDAAGGGINERAKSIPADFVR